MDIDERTTEDSWVVKTLRQYEPAGVHSQLPIVWDRADGAVVTDRAGRRWIDWTSGILTANAGHAPAALRAAIRTQVDQGLLHAYMFPTAIRARVARALCEMTGFAQVLLLTTGAEAVEAAVKIARRHAFSRHRPRALVMSFDGAFHGRTMGAQLASGLPQLQPWTGSGDDMFVHLPFPGDLEPWSVAMLDDALHRLDATAEDVACVLIEIYQGSTMRTMDGAAAQALRHWCDQHQVLLVVDEMQSGFGRTGTLFAYEQLGIRPDLLLCGKGMSGSLPASAVLLADPRYAADFAPGELTTTHGANPVCLAAVEANLHMFTDGRILANAGRIGEFFGAGLTKWAALRPERRLVMHFGMVAAIALQRPNGSDDPAGARRLVQLCADHGLLMCLPARQHGGSLIKVMPPLTTTSEELSAALAILHTAADLL